MAGLSRILFSLLQQLTSTDLAAAFRLQARDVLELARYQGGALDAVLGGLEVSALGSGVLVAPGALLQTYAGVVSPPQADESLSVLGRLGVATGVVVPPLGVVTWYLVEARAGETDTNGVRLVLNQTTQVQSPGSRIVQRDTSLVLRVRAGDASAPPAPVAGWLPLASVQRATTGDVTPGDVHDLRPLALHGAESVQARVAAQAALNTQLTTNLVALAANLNAQIAALEARLGLGYRVLSNLAFQSSDVTSSTRTWIKNNAGFLVSVASHAYGWYPLDALLVPGATINGASVRVTPGTANAAEGDRISLRLIKRAVYTPGATWTQVGALSGFDDGTDVEQTITIVPNEAVDLTLYAYALRVIGSQQGNTAIDLLHGASITQV